MKEGINNLIPEGLPQMAERVIPEWEKEMVKKPYGGGASPFLTDFWIQENRRQRQLENERGGE